MVSYALDEKKEDITGTGKVKYSPEMKEQTAKYVLEGNKLAAKL